MANQQGVQQATANETSKSILGIQNVYSNTMDIIPEQMFISKVKEAAIIGNWNKKENKDGIYILDKQDFEKQSNNL